MGTAVLYEELSDMQCIVLHAVNYGTYGEGTLWNTQDTRGLESEFRLNEMNYFLFGIN